MIAAILALATVLAGGVLTYAVDRVRQRRKVSAKALTATLLDSTRSTFLTDLALSDHAELIIEPFHAWKTFLAETLGIDITPEDCLSKLEELLSWRVHEREARINFAVMARAHDLRHLAQYYLALTHAAVQAKRKHIGPRKPGYDPGVEELITTIDSMRTSRPRRWIRRMIKSEKSELDRRDDIRILVADYSDLPERITAVEVANSGTN